MADKRKPNSESEAAEPKTSIFDLFEPPPEHDGQSFRKIPVIKDDEIDLTEGGRSAEIKAAADAEAAGLQHWTAAPTGQVPAVLTTDVDESLWADVKGPSWHGDDPSWAGPDLADVFADTQSVNLDASIDEFEDDYEDDYDDEEEVEPAAVPRQARPIGGAPAPQLRTDNKSLDNNSKDTKNGSAEIAGRTSDPRPTARPAPTTRPAPQPVASAFTDETSIGSPPNRPPLAGNPSQPQTSPSTPKSTPAQPAQRAAALERQSERPPPVRGDRDGHRGVSPRGVSQPLRPERTLSGALADARDQRAAQLAPAQTAQPASAQTTPAQPAPARQVQEPSIEDIEFANEEFADEPNFRQRVQLDPEDYESGEFGSDDYEPDQYELDEMDEANGLRPSGGRNIPQAIGVGLALGALVLAAMWFGPITTLALVVVMALLAVLELYNAMRMAGLRPATLLGIVGTVAAPAAAFYRGDAAFPLIVALAVVFGTLWYLVGADTERPVLNLSLTMLGIFWVGGLAAFAALMIRQDGGIELLLATIIITVASDTMAYIGGRAYGSRPFHHASPNKTWEGTITGFIGALFAGFAIGVTEFGTIWEANLVAAVVLGAVVGCLAPMGDLAESVVKRDLGVKDMGSLLPGHGGVLDRLDGLLFALPGAFYLALIYGLI